MQCTESVSDSCLYTTTVYCIWYPSFAQRSISTPIHTVSSLVVVDSPGFQNPASCGQQGGATFEDLCHNYLQERLQLLFHHTTLVAPRDRYVQVCEYWVCCFTENDRVVDRLELLWMWYCSNKF